MKKSLLILSMLLTSIAVNAYDVCLENVYYNLSKKYKQATVTYGEEPNNSYQGAVVIPASIEYGGVTYTVTAIGENAFAFCDNITSLTLPETIIAIGNSAFCWYTSPAAIELPESVAEIGDMAFYTTRLTSIVIPDNVKTIGTNAFLCSDRLETVHLGSGVTEIGMHAFTVCYALKEIVIPDNVVTFEAGAFDGCRELASVTIGSGLKTLGEDFFKGCVKLKDINIPDGITTIGNKAFEGCEQIETVVVGSGLTELGASSFANCGELTDFYCFAATPPAADASAFEGSDIGYATLHVLSGKAAAYGEHSVWGAFGSIEELPLGDVNGDGEVNDTDIEEVAKLIMGRSSGVLSKSAADMDNNGKVNVADIVKIVMQRIGE